MMGYFSVYESYVEDIISDHPHDCMWSGQCDPCPAKNNFLTEVKDEDEGVVLESTEELASVDLLRTNVLTPEPQFPIQQLLVQQPTPVIHPPQTTISTSTPGSPHKNKAPTDGSKSKSKFYARKKGTSQKSGFSNADSKKLRHREVEKNRHRLLQAMVKTLSERIPGRLDKETQVQTMKRAARYCVFLREVANELSRVAEPVSSSALRGKLDKIYLMARDNVDLLMTKK